MIALALASMAISRPAIEAFNIRFRCHLTGRDGIEMTTIVGDSRRSELNHPIISWVSNNASFPAVVSVDDKVAFLYKDDRYDIHFTVNNREFWYGFDFGNENEVPGTGFVVVTANEFGRPYSIIAAGLCESKAGTQIQ
jgi:hypothetical protein